MMSPWLTSDELAAASGRKRPSAQYTWAESRGFVQGRHMTDADGRPLVLRSLLVPTSTEPTRIEPDFGALHGQG